ncbi:alpha-amylase, partial [Myxococcota bacterium]|nr:alpha-amylase [Myxococcota bacterium]
MSWWKEVVFYNIYVPSFQDSNGDGSGDLRGVLQRVDYLGDLGVNALRLSGIHACPPGDDGEGVCDYSGVHPRVGDLHDLSALREALHRRGMRLVLDFVAHHTSDEHPWFQAARASRDAPNRDDYIWADPAIDGGPPNRWESARGGPAWTLDPRSGQHYLHSFLPQQPDLNWRSRRARRAILDHARAWLEWGVDGLHVSAITRLLKDQGLRSNPLKPGVSPEVAAHDPYAAQEHIYDMMTPGVHDVVRALRWAFYETPEAVLIGDVEADAAATAGFLSDGVELLHLANNAPMRRARTFAEARAAIEAAEAALHPRAWPSLALSGGDGPR